ncbi:RluA family pseudouridine synthase [Serpentinimonas barnesii]|uniref:RluA family pseudouridine synthase n=1 Tax=Serpentinimonas barnesii TaxID=1458427 RepID=UPI0005ED4895|nr:RluA family pseudouridine synthase [Serpentinimonas barnesii]
MLVAPTAKPVPPVRRCAVPPGVEVVHADAALVVLNKPAGLLSVPGKGPDNADCLSARVQALYPDALVVHRLDMATSGLLVMARGREAQRHLSRSFALRQVHKRYQALVAGIPSAPDDGPWHDIHLPLRVDWPNRPRSKVDLAHGKPSHTRWRWLETLTLPSSSAAPWVCSRLALEPIHGRSHQLRVHLMALGYPIVGDDLYAPDPVAQATPRLMLHAHRLELPHPTDGQVREFDALVPF